MAKEVFGTGEWAKHNLNLFTGCSHGCRYCYAKAMSIRFGRRTKETWLNETIREKAWLKKKTRKSVTIMYPTAHDITPKHIVKHGTYILGWLQAGNSMLIVTKPHLECIQVLTETLDEYKDKVLFRFTIGSASSKTLLFWEPGAPNFEERLESLQLAYDKGFQTSISCEPMLDNNIHEVIKLCSPYITDAIWLGKMNRMRPRLVANHEVSADVRAKAAQLERWQSDDNITTLYNKYKDNPMIKWKESIKKVVGLEVPTVKGLDI